MLSKNRRSVVLGLSFGLALPSVALAQSDSAIIEKRMQVREMARDALSTLYEFNPAARAVIEHAAGFGPSS